MEYNAVEECWRQGKDDLLVSRYYPKFFNLKSAIANTDSSCSLLHRSSELWTRNSCRYHTSSIASHVTWNRYICNYYSLDEYKVGSCWYVHSNHFSCWSGFAWLFNRISRCEDTFFSSECYGRC